MQGTVGVTARQTKKTDEKARAKGARQRTDKPNRDRKDGERKRRNKRYNEREQPIGEQQGHGTLNE